MKYVLKLKLLINITEKYIVDYISIHNLILVIPMLLYFANISTYY